MASATHRLNAFAWPEDARGVMGTVYLFGVTFVNVYLFGLHWCTYLGTVLHMAANTEFSARVTRAVKAEIARRDLSGGNLAPILGIGRNAVYARLRGDAPFDTDQLEKIADWLGISLETLFASAALEPGLKAAA